MSAVMSEFKPWAIVHIELNEAIPALTLEPDHQGLYAVFWWQGIPLGHQQLQAAQLPMAAHQVLELALTTIIPSVGDRLFDHGFKAPLPIVRARSPRDTPLPLDAFTALDHPLAVLSERMAPGEQPSVSVVVCTRDRPDQLRDCLRSLQTLSPPPTEIIVVDNAPTSEATRQQVESFPQVCYVVEPRPGLSVARNTGIQHATGDIIAFTDDDVRVHPRWIAQLRWGFHAPEVMAVTGLVLPAALQTEAQVIFETGLGGFGQGYRAKTYDRHFFEAMCDRGVPVWKMGAGANMAIRREAFERVGYFDERLGAGAAGCSEDSEFWYRLLAAGWVCQYEPSAVVFHDHRSSLERLQQQAYAYMRGHVAALLIQFQNHGHWGNLHRVGIALPRYYSRLLQQNLRQGLRRSLQQVLRGHLKATPHPRRTTLTAEILGCLSGLAFYSTARSR